MSTSYIDYIHAPQAHLTIEIQKNKPLTYIAVLYEDAQLDFRFYTTEEQCSSTIKILCIGSQGHHIRSSILSSLDHSHSQSNVYILSLLKDGSDIKVDGNVTLSPHVQKVSGHLLEENIILGNKIKVHTAPILDVHSSDVSASHGCRVERLDPKRLFYMQSRWLDQAQSQALVLDWYLNHFFNGIDDAEEHIARVQKLLS